MDDVSGVVGTVLWDVLMDNNHDSFVLAEWFIKSLKAKDYEIVKVGHQSTGGVS